MKNKSTMRKLAFILLSVILSYGFQSGIKAQEQVASMMKAGIEDANKLIDAYISPLGNAFGTAINSGWFNTARYLKPGGIDLNISLNGIMVPNSAKTFDFSELGTSTLVLIPGTGTEAPTFFGDNKEGPEFGVKFTSTNPPIDTILEKFNSPAGIGFGFWLLPSAQLRIGTCMHTDFIIRYMPTIKLKGDISGEISMWGLGVKHDIKQWIPVINDMPFDLAVMFSYSKLSFDVNFGRQLLPDASAVYDTISYTKPSDNPGTYDDQGLTYDINAISFAAIISKKLSVLTLYGGLGFNSSKAEMNLKGHYPVLTNYALTSGGSLYKISKDFVDPVNISTSLFTPKVTAGFRLKLAFFTLNADYTLSKYSYFSAGIGFVFRESKEAKAH